MEIETVPTFKMVGMSMGREREERTMRKDALSGDRYSREAVGTTLE